MGAKAKKLMKKNLSKVTSQLSVLEGKKESADFLPLEGGPGRKLPVQKPLENTATVVYIGRIPHGFYEKEMEGMDRTLEEHKKLLDRIVKRDEIKRKRIKAAGIDYECPEIVGSVRAAPKKIKFDED